MILLLYAVSIYDIQLKAPRSKRNGMIHETKNKYYDHDEYHHKQLRITIDFN
jgi:hypothetical protein